MSAWLHESLDLASTDQKVSGCSTLNLCSSSWLVIAAPKLPSSGISVLVTSPAAPRRSVTWPCLSRPPSSLVPATMLLSDLQLTRGKAPPQNSSLPWPLEPLELVRCLHFLVPSHCCCPVTAVSNHNHCLAAAMHSDSTHCTAHCSPYIYGPDISEIIPGTGLLKV